MRISDWSSDVCSSDLSYKAPQRDMQFALFDVLGAQALYQRLGFEAAQRDVLDAVLEEGARFTEQVLAPLNQTGDAEGCGYDKASGTVSAPKGFKQAYQQFVDGGWNGLAAHEAS